MMKVNTNNPPPPPPLPLFPNLSGIAVRSPLLNSLFSYATANNVASVCTWPKSFTQALLRFRHSGIYMGGSPLRSAT